MEKLALILFSVCLFLLPTTHYGIPIGGFKLTLSDSFLLLSLATLALFPNRIMLSKKLSSFLVIVLLMFSTFLLSVPFGVKIINSVKSFLPWIYSFLFLLVGSVLWTFFQKKFIRHVLIASTTSLLLSFLPAYLAFFRIYRNPLFYHKGQVRYSYLTANTNQYAAYIVMTIFTIVLCHQTLRPGKGSKRYFLLAILNLIPSTLTGSKTGFAMAIALLGITGFNFYRSSKGLIRVLNLTFLSSVVISIVVFWSHIIERIQQSYVLYRAFSVIDLLSGNEESSEAQIDVRAEQLEGGLELFWHNPLFGIGIGNYKAYSGHHEIHNTFAALLVETGLVGFGAFLFLLYFIIHNIFRSPIVKFRVISLGFVFLFSVMNFTHLYLRERWTWVFLFVLLVFQLRDYKAKQLPFVHYSN